MVYPQVSFDGSANEACRAQNNYVCGLEEDVPARGGVIQRYAALQGEQRAIACEEYTMVKFESEDAMEFVAL